MTNEAYFSPKWVLTPQKKTSYHIFEMDIFSNFFGDVMSHIIRQNAGKKINTISELFINEFLIFPFVSFKCVQTIGYTKLCKQIQKQQKF